MPKPKPKLDSYSHHEVRDRATLLVDVIETHLLAHPVVQRSPYLIQQAEFAQDLLQSLASACTQKHDR